MVAFLAMSDWYPPSERTLQTAAALYETGKITDVQLQEAVKLCVQWKVTLPDVLSAMYKISTQIWGRQMAQTCGLPFFDSQELPFDISLLDKTYYDVYLRYLFIPWQREAGGVMVIVARDPDDPNIQSILHKRYPDCIFRYEISGKLEIIRVIQGLFDTILSERAREELFLRSPALSAKTTFSTGQRWNFVGLMIFFLLGMTLQPHFTLVLLTGLTSGLYMLLFFFRGLLTIIGSGRKVDLSVSQAEIDALDDAKLPVFTVLVPMYREAEVLPILVSSIRKMDYPRAKLDVKLVLEANDYETINRAKALGAEDLFEIIRVPDSQPKTKPKACNYALRFARGKYVVVFDAEDIPEPDQLKKVIALFLSSPENVACVQARLNYFNRDDNFLTRMFTLEYSHWFDYLLPGLHLLNIPIPLGGTSNHFRTDILISLGGWDPYNVTEDADLGVRLTQAGYRVAVVNSTTFEEANGVLKSWINQRSRWIKGYMQTWLVHMRHPVQLYRRLGFVGFMGFQMFIGFPPFTALINPFLWAVFVLSLLMGPSNFAALFPPVVLAMALFDLLIGNLMYVYFNITAASKRRWYSLVPWGLLAPAYWVLHSVAAYKALGQLITNPHYWEKTQHGTSSQTMNKVTTLNLDEAVLDKNS